MAMKVMLVTAKNHGLAEAAAKKSRLKTGRVEISSFSLSVARCNKSSCHRLRHRARQLAGAGEIGATIKRAGA